MIHEPECALAGKQYTVQCGICATIQKAYLRGRKDAAESINCIKEGLITRDRLWVSYRDAYDAANGDGELTDD